MNTDLYEKKKVVIYGLGLETEKALPKISTEHEVIGLLDSFTTSGELYGYKILDINDVVKIEDVKIIVVARPGSCRAIAKKIGDLCRENHVPLFDVRGNDLLKEKKAVYNFRAFAGYKREDLLSMVSGYEAVSFDFFDTLVVRNVLAPTDIFELIDVQLKERGIFIDDFVGKRNKAEKQLAKNAPFLDTIYESFVATDFGVTAAELAEIEFETDKKTLRPRIDMIDFVSELKKKGIKVYITTDTYYTKLQIKELLLTNGIDEYDEIIASCEYKKNKSGGLFDDLKNEAGTSDIVHVGDDLTSDYESAKSYGIEAFKINSAAEFFDMAGELDLSMHIKSLCDKVKVGMLVADLFNSPFQFENEEKELFTKKSFNVGYLFCAPMFADFSLWFTSKIENEGIKNVWLGARDGYLIQKLFRIISPDIKTDYFLTSRTAAIRAGMENDDDIAYVDDMKFSGSIEDNISKRFGIDVRNEVRDDSKTGLFIYRDLILSESARKKENNLKYIKRLNLAEGEIAFFDFVAKGTAQMFTARLVDNKVKGLYFLQNEPEYMKSRKLAVEPFYDEASRENSAIFEDYYILETILTSPEPSVCEFDENGNPIFSQETRSTQDIDCIMRAQDGIIEFVKDYFTILNKKMMIVNRNLDEAILRLIHNVKIEDSDFTSLTVEDPFFNRMTSISDVL